MADMISKLKTAALVAGAALFVVACGEKAAEPAAELDHHRSCSGCRRNGRSGC